MSQSRIDPAKLRVPGLTHAPLRRERLIRRLDAHPGRVVAVVAPAGFGKTVLVADWLAARGGPAAWVSLDPLDEDPARLAEHLAEGLRGFDGVGEHAAGSVGASLLQVARGEAGAAARLSGALERIDPGAVLVLDDLHHLEAAPALDLLEHVVHAPHSRLHIVLVSRTDPPFALARLRLSGQLLELRARELAFTLDEARAFFGRTTAGTGRAGARLTDADLAALLDRTEGWPAGLRLAEISLAEADDPGAFVASFTGTHRFVTEYLLEEALGRQSPELQRFLMESAVLTRFDADSCRRVLGDVRAGRRIDEVRAAGLFLMPLGPDGRWFRYHHLFGELLTHRLSLADPARLDALRAAASREAESRGDVGQAMEYAAGMDGDGRLLELLDAHGLTLLGRSAMAGLRRWLGAVDLTRVRPYPVAWCADAWLRVVTERIADPAPLVARIEAALALAGEGYDPARRERARLHTHILSAYAARYRHRWAEALSAGEAAEATMAHPEPLSRGFLVYNTARVRMALGEMPAAAELLERALPDHLAAGNRYLLLATLGRRAAVRLQTRGVAAALESLEAADAFIAEHGLGGNPACAIVEFHRGWTHLAAHRLDAADAAFDAALELAGPRDFPEERGNALLGRARVALARAWLEGAPGRSGPDPGEARPQRDLERADATLTELAALSQGGNVDLFETTLDLERTRLRLVRWELDPSGPPPEEPDRAALGEPGEPWTVLRESAALLALRRAVALGDAGAVVVADEVVRRSREGERGEALIVALLARALVGGDASPGSGVDEALQHAARRDDLSVLQHLGRPAGRGIRAALARGLASPEGRRMAARLLAGVADDGEASAPAGGGLPEALPGGLTDREEEVLALLFDGLSNKALSRRLFVSVDTVKTHLKHIYAKLGVTNRSRAVARARELGFGPPRR